MHKVAVASSNLVPRFPDLFNSRERCKDHQGALGRGYYQLLLLATVWTRASQRHYIIHTNVCHAKPHPCTSYMWSKSTRLLLIFLLTFNMAHYWLVCEKRSLGMRLLNSHHLCGDGCYHVTHWEWNLACVSTILLKEVSSYRNMLRENHTLFMGDHAYFWLKSGQVKFLLSVWEVPNCQLSQAS